MPNKTHISESDYDGILLGIAEHFKNDPTFKDYNFEGSGLRALLRVLALHSSDLSLSANLTFNERFIKTAEIRGNAAANSGDQGYVPHSKVCSNALCVITVETDLAEGTEVSISRTNTFLGVKDGRAFTFSPDQTYTSTVSNGIVKFENVNLKQGVWAAQTYNIVGTGIKSLKIDNPNVDVTTLLVDYRPSLESNEIESYKRYMSLFDLGPDEAIFYLSLGRDELYTMEFGDGILSKNPEEGVIVAQFLYTEGSVANGIKNLTPSTVIAESARIKVTLSEPTFGGGDAESIESIRQSAPLYFGSRGVAVTEDQYKPIVREVFPQADVLSWGGEVNDPPKNGFVFVSVNPADGETLTESQKELLKQYLDGRNVGSITPIIVDPEYFYINVETTVVWDPKYTNLRSTDLERLAKDSITDWSVNNLELFKRDFDLLSLAEYIKTVERSFVTNYTNVKYEKTKVNADAGVYEFNFYRSFDATSLVVSGVETTLGASVSITTKDDSLYIGSERVGGFDSTTGFVSIKIPEGYAAPTLSVVVTPNGSNQNVKVGTNQILKIKNVTVTMEAGSHVQ